MEYIKEIDHGLIGDSSTTWATSVRFLKVVVRGPRCRASLSPHSSPAFDQARVLNAFGPHNLFRLNQNVRSSTGVRDRATPWNQDAAGS